MPTHTQFAVLSFLWRLQFWPKKRIRNFGKQICCSFLIYLFSCCSGLQHVVSSGQQWSTTPWSHVCAPVHVLCATTIAYANLDVNLQIMSLCLSRCCLPQNQRLTFNIHYSICTLFSVYAVFLYN